MLSHIGIDAANLKQSSAFDKKVKICSVEKKCREMPPAQNIYGKPPQCAEK